MCTLENKVAAGKSRSERANPPDSERANLAAEGKIGKSGSQNAGPSANLLQRTKCRIAKKNHAPSSSSSHFFEASASGETNWWLRVGRPTPPFSPRLVYRRRDDGDGDVGRAERSPPPGPSDSPSLLLLLLLLLPPDVAIARRPASTFFTTGGVPLDLAPEIPFPSSSASASPFSRPPPPPDLRPPSPSRRGSTGSHISIVH
jgi:hypothetical protein